MAKTDLPVLEQRRIEAAILKPVYEAMCEQFGAEAAKAVLKRAIVKDAIETGAAYAAAVPADSGQTNDLKGFAGLMPQWTAHGALEMNVETQTADRFDYTVTRCKYAEMYREMGMADIGHLLSCARDGTFCTGYNPGIKLKQTQTIMGGAAYCDFSYRLDKNPKDKNPED